MDSLYEAPGLGTQRPQPWEVGSSSLILISLAELTPCCEGNPPALPSGCTSGTAAASLFQGCCAQVCTLAWPISPGELMLPLLAAHGGSRRHRGLAQCPCPTVALADHVAEQAVCRWPQGPGVTGNPPRALCEIQDWSGPHTG